MRSDHQESRVVSQYFMGGGDSQANLGISHSTSQSGSPGSFFRFPLEIRELIYEFYSINDRLIWSFKSQKDHDKAHERSTDRQITSDTLSRVLGPSANALIHTSRQTYLEGSKIFYQTNGFSLYSGWTLRKFLWRMQRVHIQAIRELHIAHPFYVDAMSKGAPKSIDDDLGILKSFTNLEILHLAGMSYSVPVGGFDNTPSRRAHVVILHTLYVLATDILTRLKKIRLTVDMPRSEIFYIKGFTLTFDQIPGWVYSVDVCKKVYQPRRVWTVTEILEQVHEPFWPGSPAEVRKVRRERKAGEGMAG